jgi:hypothetical protein
MARLLEAEHGPLFGPAEIAAVNAAFDAALRRLELVDRHAAGHHTSLAEDNNGSVLVPDQRLEISADPKALCSDGHHMMNAVHMLGSNASDDQIGSSSAGRQ